MHFTLSTLASVVAALAVANAAAVRPHVARDGICTVKDICLEHQNSDHPKHRTDIVWDESSLSTTAPQAICAYNDGSVCTYGIALVEGSNPITYTLSLVAAGSPALCQNEYYDAPLCTYNPP
ncbi:hypothetical protein FRB99_003359, partial [Tulasnella sp. 403]